MVFEEKIYQNAGGQGNHFSRMGQSAGGFSESEYQENCPDAVFFKEKEG